FNFSFDCSFSFHLNCCIFCNSCFLGQLTFLVNIFDMPGNNGLIPLKQIRYLLQWQPKGVAFKTNLNLSLAITSLVDFDLAFHKSFSLELYSDYSSSIFFTSWSLHICKYG